MRSSRWLLIGCMGLCSILGSERCNGWVDLGLGARTWERCLVDVNAMYLVKPDFLTSPKASNRVRWFRSTLFRSHSGSSTPRMN
jgi:hypothetical protein